MNKTILMLMLSGIPSALNAQTTGLDPFSRDEDISGAQLSVDVQSTSDGFFTYNYTLTSPAINKGVILSLDIDISCPEVDSREGLPPQNTESGYEGDHSPDGKHSAVNVTADFGSASTFAIDARNQADWGISLKPGEGTTGLRIISTRSPKARHYVLTPSMDTGAPWDYSNVDPTDPNLPWIDDFTVFGMTQGPRCPGDETPPPVTFFPGTPKPEETTATNNLLTYSEPLMDRLHVAPGTGELALTIHYADDIDPKTFRVEPQSDKLRKLFNPQKGTSETVHIPLDAGKNKFILSVQREFTPPGQQKTSATPAQGKQGLEKDIDVFEVRVDAASATTGKKNGK